MNRMFPLALLALSGCIVVGGDGEDEVVWETYRAIASDGLTALHVEQTVGDLEVLSDPEAVEITLEAWIVRTGRVSGTGWVTDVSLRDNGSTAVAYADIDGLLINYEAHTRIIAPPHLAVVVDDGSGDTWVRGFASADVLDGSGDLDVDDIAGAVLISDDSGELSVVGAAGDVAIYDGTGDLHVEETGGDVHIEDSSGDIRVSDVAGLVTISDGSGDIWLEDVGGYEILDDTSGDVHLP